MHRDEREIRQLVETWIAAAEAGDIDTILSLLADDVVFLLPGQPPLVGKSAYAEAARRKANRKSAELADTSEIRQIRVFGDRAFMWAKLPLLVTPDGGAQTMMSVGHTLSILRRENGKWVLSDANMLPPRPGLQDRGFADLPLRAALPARTHA